ncbi:MAG: type VI secretion system-associated FHA domain protein TagH [Thiolinea sp.]
MQQTAQQAAPPAVTYRDESARDDQAGHFLEAFLQGAGVDDPQLRQGMAAELQPEALGQLFRILLAGIMDTLHTRTEIKSEMRMDVTTIQPIRNNPVKFSVSVDEAISRLLLPQGQAFLPATQALEEAFEDVRAHQVAVIAGVQAALKQVLKRFEPERLEARLHKESPIIANIPIQREASLWALFETLYSTIQGEAEDDFQKLFGLTARAYQQVEQLESFPEGTTCKALKAGLSMDKIGGLAGRFVFAPPAFSTAGARHPDWVESRCETIRPYTWGFELTLDTRLLALAGGPAVLSRGDAGRYTVCRAGNRIGSATLRSAR